MSYSQFLNEDVVVLATDYALRMLDKDGTTKNTSLSQIPNLLRTTAFIATAALTNNSCIFRIQNEKQLEDEKSIPF